MLVCMGQCRARYEPVPCTAPKDTGLCHAQHPKLRHNLIHGRIYDVRKSQKRAHAHFKWPGEIAYMRNLKFMTGKNDFLAQTVDGWRAADILKTSRSKNTQVGLLQWQASKHHLTRLTERAYVTLCKLSGKFGFLTKSPKIGGSVKAPQ